MSDHIFLCLPACTVPWPGQSLQSTSLQDFGAQYLETEASRIALRSLNESIEAFSVSGGDPVIEIAENGITIVLNSQGERQEGIEDIRCDVLEPIKVALQGGFLGWCFIDVVERFLESICAC